MAKPKEPKKKPVVVKLKSAPKTKEDVVEDILSELSGTTNKAATWAVTSVLKEHLPEGYDPQLRALSYIPAHTAAYLSAYIALSKNLKDLDTARFEARASAKGVVLSLIDPILNPPPVPIGFRIM